MIETVVDEEAWLLASPQKPRRGRGALALVAGVLATSLALVAVRGAFTPSAPRPAGRLYYEAGQTFAELQTSLAEGPGYGQTMPGHNVDGGFRPVLNAGPDLSEVTQPGLGQGNTFVTSWDDMRKK